ncbi:MAG: HAD-IA family hydrolase [Amaricoccus sp.]
MSRRALLFDLDGTLVDSDPLHHAAFAEIMAERGRELTIDEYRATIMGQPNAAILAQHFPGEDVAILHRKERMVIDRLADAVEPIAGIHALLDWAEAAGAACAVVTNAPRANAIALLTASSLGHRLPTLVIGEECDRPKPDPAPYQAAMRALGVTPSQSIAFEDSRSGIRAARDAGVRVFGITSGLSADELLAAGAHAAIRDFTDPALWAHLDRLP